MSMRVLVTVALMLFAGTCFAAGYDVALRGDDTGTGSKARSSMTITSDGWTIGLDEEHRTFRISHETLGTVLKDVRLNLRGERGLNPLKKWSVEKQGEGVLSVITRDPRTAWLFELSPNLLKISSTSTDAVLTAQAVASTDRVVARLLDPQGVPVTWVGTDAGSSWGAGETRNPSFLPHRNPECMYFALGQVSGTNLHGLFDRRSDTAISFSASSSMERNGEDADLLDVTIPVPGNTLIRTFPDYFTKTLGVPFYVPFDDSDFPTAPIVWGSWSSYYQDVTEHDIVQNTDWLAKKLAAYGVEYILLDDGYDRGKNGEHRWIGSWDGTKFPHGPRWLAEYIKSKGLHPGLWIVPNAYAGATDEHPEWYLRHKLGKFILDYNTPTLDYTHPEVLEFLKKLFTTLDDWGFEYYKFDGDFAFPAYAPAVDRDKLFDKTIGAVDAYRNRMMLIRDIVGPRTLLEGSPEGTPLNGIGYFTSYWNGYDDYNGWQGMHRLLSSISDNAFLNHIVMYLMPGEGIDVSPWMPMEEAKQKRHPAFVADAEDRQDHEVGFGTSLAESRTLVTYLALTGVVYSMASVMPELPEERTNLLKQTLPTLPILPIDLFSRGTDMNYQRFQYTTPDIYIHNYPEILDLKVNAKSGVYDVVGLTNWRSDTATRELLFADKLGLDARARYVAFDFWGQRLLGVFKDRMKVAIEPHDTRVFLIHPFLNRPQLIATARHITGAYSIKDLAWYGSKNRLHGTSDTVPGDDYTLWFFVPEGFKVTRLKVASPGRREIPARHELAGNSLNVSFPGQHEPVDWEVEFHRNSGE